MKPLKVLLTALASLATLFAVTLALAQENGDVYLPVVMSNALPPTPEPTATPCATLQGEIKSDTILKQGCRYSVTANVLVRSSAALTVEAGVVLMFEGPYYLKVDGRLETQGNALNPVRLTSSQETKQPGDWKWVEIDSPLESNIAGTVIEYATTGLRLYNGRKNVRNSTITRSKQCAVISGDGEISISDSVITDNGGCALNASGVTGRVSVAGNSIRLNKGSETIVLYYAGQEHSFTQNRVEENSSAYVLYLVGAAAEINGNVFLGNKASSVIHVQSEHSPIQISCNTFVSNTLSNSNPAWAASVFLSYSPATDGIAVVNNDFHPNPAGYDFSVTEFVENDINADGNFWQSTNPSEIDARIYDFNDDFYLHRVKYVPYLESPPSCSPNR